MLFLSTASANSHFQHLLSVTSEKTYISSPYPNTSLANGFRQQEPLLALLWLLPWISLLLAFILKSQAEVERKQTCCRMFSAQLAGPTPRPKGQLLLHFTEPGAEHGAPWCATAGTFTLVPNTRLWHYPSCHTEGAALHCCSTWAFQPATFNRPQENQGLTCLRSLALSQLKGSPTPHTRASNKGTIS